MDRKDQLSTIGMASSMGIFIGPLIAAAAGSLSWAVALFVIFLFAAMACATAS